MDGDFEANTPEWAWQRDESGASIEADLVDAARHNWACMLAYLREIGQPFFTKNVQLRASNYHENGGKERRLECLWKNF